MTVPFLKKNDRVTIVATAKRMPEGSIEAAVRVLSAWGLEVTLLSDPYMSVYEYAGDDAFRLEALQAALDDPSIKAIFCARGGYGTGRIVDGLSWKRFKRNPKWIVGFSDVTQLLTILDNKGFPSIHGLMPIHFGDKKYRASLLELRGVLFGEPSKPMLLKNHRLNRNGSMTGQLTGGNLTILSTTIGTSAEVDTKGKILFIEDVGEYLYRIDRMMIHLKRANTLKKIKGLLVGHFTDLQDNEHPFGKSAYEIIYDAVKEYDYPVVFGVPAGHDAPNYPLVVGGHYAVSCTGKSSSIRLVDRDVISK